MDIDNDGLPDIVTTSVLSLGDSYICILLRKKPISVCEGASAMLTAVAGISNQWQVDMGNGYVNLANTNNYNGVNTRILRITNIPAAWNGYVYRCLIDGAASPFQVLSVGQSKPTITINASGCLSAGLAFTATATDPGTAPVYQWKRNGVPVGANSPTYTSTALTTGDVITCGITSNALCVTEPNASSNSITIQPAVTPSININVSPAGSICPGTTLTFTATTTAGGTTPVYQWLRNGVPVGANTATFSSAALTDNDNITCQLLSNADCVTSNTATSNAVTVNMPPLASGTITPAAVQLCAGASQLLVCNSNSGALQWWYNGVPVAGANSSTYLATTPGNYTVKFANGSCASSEATNTAIVAITPLPTGTITPSSAAICSGSNQLLTASGGTSYQWALNGVPIPGAVEPTHIATVAGFYTTVVTKDN